MVALLRRSFARARGLLLPLTVVRAIFQVLVVAAAAYLEGHQGFSGFVLTTARGGPGREAAAAVEAVLCGVAYVAFSRRDV